ncbi:Deoxynucleoside triphosphate triphosphohydrolase SAMHD1 [Sesamum angolense]|uniref:Deoxynucleoside triphosphate triphosphohydrolase SAMHD1 n=1 Tax=Sesamum angolense TaxID=2727404 RepID=A0AAE2BYW3_9LAMI|nr:Deoxynucleoside triphosphate triphosphohydrolase SAMHD1 [Sesamum angolense]
MGAKYCEEELPSNNFALASTDDRRFSKHIHDNVHGNIYIDPDVPKLPEEEKVIRSLNYLSTRGGFHSHLFSLFALQLSLKFVDTEQFQRLRDLKQLGKFSEFVLYEFAISNGDAFARPCLTDQVNYRCASGFSYMVYPGAVHSRFEHSLGVYWLASEAINRLKTYQSFKEKLFLYDIVNGRNGIDVDKFDYIIRDSRACGLGCNFEFQRVLETMRVIDDEICYRAKEYLTIHKLFATRADLHRMVYMHAKVKAIELMFVDAMTKANDVLCISSYIDEPAEYWKDYESSEKFNIKDDLVSHLLPTSYQDMIVRVYSKKPHLVEAVSEAFENFQLKTYGKKAQVHATPEKKKRKRLRYISGAV